MKKLRFITLIISFILALAIANCWAMPGKEEYGADSSQSMPAMRPQFAPVAQQLSDSVNSQGLATQNPPPSDPLASIFERLDQILGIQITDPQALRGQDANIIKYVFTGETIQLGPYILGQSKPDLSFPLALNLDSKNALPLTLNFDSQSSLPTNLFYLHPSTISGLKAQPIGALKDIPTFTGLAARANEFFWNTTTDLVVSSATGNANEHTYDFVTQGTSLPTALSQFLSTGNSEGFSKFGQTMGASWNHIFWEGDRSNLVSRGLAAGNLFTFGTAGDYVQGKPGSAVSFGTTIVAVPGILALAPAYALPALGIGEAPTFSTWVLPTALPAIEGAVSDASWAATKFILQTIPAQAGRIIAGAASLPIVQQIVNNPSVQSTWNTITQAAESPAGQKVLSLINTGGQFLGALGQAQMAGQTGIMPTDQTLAVEGFLPALALAIENYKAGFTLANPLLTEINTIASEGTIEISRLAPHEPAIQIKSVEYALDQLAKGNSLLPVKITQYGGQLYTVDGYNRTVASLIAGKQSVEYVFVPFEQLEPAEQWVITSITNGTRPAFLVPASSYSLQELAPAGVLKGYGYGPVTIKSLLSFYEEQGGLASAAENLFNFKGGSLVLSAAGEGNTLSINLMNPVPENFFFSANPPSTRPQWIIYLGDTADSDINTINAWHARDLFSNGESFTIVTNMDQLKAVMQLPGTQKSILVLNAHGMEPGLTGAASEGVELLDQLTGVKSQWSGGAIAEAFREAGVNSTNTQTVILSNCYAGAGPLGERVIDRALGEFSLNPATQGMKVIGPPGLLSWEMTNKGHFTFSIGDESSAQAFVDAVLPSWLLPLFNTLNK